MWRACSRCLAFCCYILRIAFDDWVLWMDFLMVEGSLCFAIFSVKLLKHLLNYLTFIVFFKTNFKLLKLFKPINDMNLIFASVGD